MASSVEPITDANLASDHFPLTMIVRIILKAFKKKVITRRERAARMMMKQLLQGIDGSRHREPSVNDVRNERGGFAQKQIMVGFILICVSMTVRKGRRYENHGIYGRGRHLTMTS